MSEGEILSPRGKVLAVLGSRLREIKLTFPFYFCNKTPRTSFVFLSSCDFLHTQKQKTDSIDFKNPEKVLFLPRSSNRIHIFNDGYLLDDRIELWRESASLTLLFRRNQIQSGLLRRLRKSTVLIRWFCNKKIYRIIVFIHVRK